MVLACGSAAVYRFVMWLRLRSFLSASSALRGLPAFSLRRSATAVLLMGLGAGLSSTACGPKVIRETVVQNDQVTIQLRQQELRDPEKDPEAERFSHPAIVAPTRLAAILAQIAVRPKDGEARERQDAVPTSLIFPLADGISRGLAKAGPRQEVVAMGRRSERQLGVFTREYLTSLVAVVRGDQLELHFSHLDWPIPGDPDAQVREPWRGKAVSRFRVIPGERIEPVGTYGVAVSWRDPAFSDTSTLRRGPGGRVRRRTILMESSEDAEP